MTVPGPAGQHRLGGDPLPSGFETPDDYGFATRAIRAGQPHDPRTGGVVTPISLATTFAQDGIGEPRFGYEYARTGNPTRHAYETCMASLEGASRAFAFASGLAAEDAVLRHDAYGGTFRLIDKVHARGGVTSTAVDLTDPSSIAAAWTPATRMVWLETPTNPLLTVIDIDAVCRIVHELGGLVVVDNTFGQGGYVVRPIEHGVDIVTHSATKWIGGHGTSIGGVIVDSGNFDWRNGRFPLFTEPSDAYHGLVFSDVFHPESELGNVGFIIRARVEGLRDLGPALSPFNAFLLLQGVETLSLRAQRHAENANKLAAWLNDHDAVEWVWHPSLEGHHSHEAARRYFREGAFGSVLSFGIRGGKEAGQAFIEGVELASHLANVGDAKTLVIHPSSTTHQQLSDAEQRASGVTPELVRVSVGIEHIDDILADFEQAFAKTLVAA